VKVARLRKILDRLTAEDDICVLLWEKYEFDGVVNDYVVTPEAWTQICEEFDNWESAGADIGEWFIDALNEHCGEQS
jgi:hypothetical protein